MIEVEIRGPVAKKEYEKLKKILKKAGGNVREKNMISLTYSPELVLTNEDGAVELSSARGNESTKTMFSPNEFSKIVTMLHSLGHSKGTVMKHDTFQARYGGAEFMLSDMGRGAYYYEAGISVKDPASAKEALSKLSVLARQFRLPMWTEEEVRLSSGKVSEPQTYIFDYTVDGAKHFKDAFGI